MAVLWSTKMETVNCDWLILSNDAQFWSSTAHDIHHHHHKQAIILVTLLHSKLT